MLWKGGGGGGGGGGVKVSSVKGETAVSSTSGQCFLIHVVNST